MIGGTTASHSRRSEHANRCPAAVLWGRFARRSGMCLVLLVNESVASTGPRRLSVVRRTHWLRLFALLIALLGLVGPAARAHAHGAPKRPGRAARGRARAEYRDPCRARRVGAARCCVRRSLLACRGSQNPSFNWPRFGVRACPALPSAGPSYVSLSHFHSKRRIPRMNSEEPPRA